MPNQDLSESGKEKIRTRTEGEAKVYSTRRRGWRCKESLGAWNKKSCNEKLDRDSLPILCWLRCMIRSPSFPCPFIPPPVTSVLICCWNVATFLWICTLPLHVRMSHRASSLGRNKGGQSYASRVCVVVVVLFG